MREQPAGLGDGWVNQSPIAWASCRVPPAFAIGVAPVLEIDQVFLGWMENNGAGDRVTLAVWHKVF